MNFWDVGASGGDIFGQKMMWVWDQKSDARSCFLRLPLNQGRQYIFVL